MPVRRYQPLVPAKCTGDSCDCLDAPSWFPGIQLKHVLIEQSYLDNSNYQELADHLNIILHDILQRRQTCHTDGISGLLDSLRHLKLIGTRDVLLEMLRDVFVIQDSDFHHKFNWDAWTDLRISLLERVQKDPRFEIPSNMADVQLDVLGPSCDCPLHDTYSEFYHI